MFYTIVKTYLVIGIIWSIIVMLAFSILRWLSDNRRDFYQSYAIEHNKLERFELYRIVLHDSRFWNYHTITSIILEAIFIWPKGVYEFYKRRCK